MVARAVGWSVALHVSALLALALLWPRLQAAHDDALTHDPWLTQLRWLALPEPEAAPRAEPPTVIELRTAADAERDVAHPGAPTQAPNFDPTAGAAAASSGHGAGAPTLVTDRADAVSLRVQPFDAESGYAMQRIATSERRRLSREQVRATPHAAASPWLASAAHGHGHNAADLRERARPTETAIVATRRDASDHEPDHEPDHEIDHAPPAESRRATAGFSRPEVARGPASTDAAEESDDVADRVDRALVSDEKAPAPLELSHPTSPGHDASGKGETVGALGYAPRVVAPSAAPVPTGAPNLPDARELAAATYQRVYNLYLSRMKQKIDPLWEFPRELAIRMEQGDVLVGFTIRRDGSVRDIRVLKGSGFPSFDKNVLAAVKKAAPFEPLPATFGAELKVTAPFEGSNPAIR